MCEYACFLRIYFVINIQILYFSSFRTTSGFFTLMFPIVFAASSYNTLIFPIYLLFFSCYNAVVVIFLMFILIFLLCLIWFWLNQSNQKQVYPLFTQIEQKVTSSCINIIFQNVSLAITIEQPFICAANFCFDSTSPKLLMDLLLIYNRIFACKSFFPEAESLPTWLERFFFSININMFGM